MQSEQNEITLYKQKLKTIEQERLINQSLDLAKLSQNLLKGEELTSFIKRSFDFSVELNNFISNKTKSY